ncbi:hypothetical protein [Silvanigrella sp.]|jgi:hypothetical protein|uniref:hypothetical protein n=1 Tax=Silvanigrella sp. TaxID=2024976 RepID=UPI0037C9B716|nr:hypothetical protein [Silvanigrellaceae bacterium]
MKIDLRFTLESENEDHRKALNFYNNLRRKNRVDVFVELTKQFWDKEFIDGGESILERKENNTVKSIQAKSIQIPNEDNKPKKKNPLLG